MYAKIRATGRQKLCFYSTCKNEGVFGNENTEEYTIKIYLIQLVLYSVSLNIILSLLRFVD